MAFTKYINIKDVVKLTGHTTDEIRGLAQTGVLPAHKTRRGHWRLHVDAVEKYFGIQINKSIIEEEKLTEAIEALKTSSLLNEEKANKTPKTRVVPRNKVTRNESPVNEETFQAQIHSDGTRLIINGNHYQEVLERICTAKSSIIIMTADFKRFNLKPTGSQGKDYKDGTPFIKYLMSKAVQGVSVRIICSRPSTTFTEEWKEYYRQMMNPTLFKYKYCNRNHAKIVIVDDRFAYIGSANVTPAGLGQGIFTPGNFEAGIITEELSVISSAKELFSMIWNDNYCTNCHRADNCTD